MKKSRMILSAIAVITIVGTALAFKSVKASENLFICNSQQICVRGNTVGMSDIFSTQQLDPRPQDLFKGTLNSSCAPGGTCVPYPNQAPVYINL